MTIIIPQLDHIAPPAIADEIDRLEDLYSMGILDTAAETRFDQFSALAATVFNTPMAAISLIDSERLWTKSAFGFAAQEMPRHLSLCNHTISEPETMIVEDTRADERFVDHPMVVGHPQIRFYAGAVIRGPSGQPVGTCSILDLSPRAFSERDRSILLRIARIVEQDLQQRKQVDDLKEKVRSLMLVDHATGLPNHNSFLTDLNAALQRAAGADKPIVLALIRVIRFNSLDSAIGREAIGYVMSTLASRLGAALGKDCRLARTREDKLGLFLPVAENAAVGPALQQMIKSAEEPIQLGSHIVRLKVSIGASVFPYDADDAERLVRRARTALWSRSLSNRSGFSLYRKRFSDAASRQFVLESAIRNGLARNEFSLAFQAKVSLASNRVAGAEALIRWDSAELGNVPPDQFIPVAEDSDLISEIGTQVLDSTCRFLHEMGARQAHCPAISINITSHQLRNTDFAAWVNQFIQQFGLDPRQLVLELTESSLVEDIDDAAAILNSLREIGVGVAIDDFGTGFSCLSYLQRLPITELKIDGSFINRIPAHEGDMKLAHSIVSIGKTLGLTVVAEGVETEGQVEYLRSIGCDQAQGFYFCQPLPAAEFMQYLERQHEDELVQSVG